MKNWKKGSIIILLEVIVSIIVNAMVYNQLPEKAALQIKTSGELSNFVPKIVFVLVCPVLLIIDLIYSKADDSNNAKAALIGTIMFFAGLFSIYFNLRA